MKSQIIDITKNLLEKRSVINIVKSSLLESADLENIYYFYKKLIEKIVILLTKDEMTFNNSMIWLFLKMV